MDDVKIALDTNILAYGEGINDGAAHTTAERLVHSLPASRTYIPVQVLGEFFNVLVRKGRRHPRDARTAVEELGKTFQVIETTYPILQSAMQLASDRQLQIWDAIILAAAASAGCTMLLSEDFQHGFAWGGVTVVNPFTEPQHALLTSILTEP